MSCASSGLAADDALHVLRDDVDLEVDRLARMKRAERDEALLHHVAGERLRQREAQARALALSRPVLELGRRVDMALHEMTAERCLGGRGALQVHASAARQGA